MKILIPVIIFLIFSEICVAQISKVPFRVKQDLYDYKQSETLGLSFAEGTETFTIFKARQQTDKYCNGVVLFPFKDFLYAQWQSSAKDEDASDTQVVYSRSPDGINWSAPKVLVNRWHAGIKTSGGWWSDSTKLVAYINVWPEHLEPKGGYTEYISSNDGEKWTDPKPITDDNGKPIPGIFEQDPHALPDGRIINAIHLQPGLILKPFYTDNPLGISGWTKGIMQNMPYNGTVSREIESSWFYRSDSSIIMIYRDQNSTYRKLASLSSDRGETWSTPVLTTMPDSRSKQSAGNLPDGTAFMVNNPVNNKNRFPLVITLSKTGHFFDKACLLRAGGTDLQPLRYNGKYKREGYHYPKSVIWKNYLYISYATNKEDAQLTRVPLKSLSYK